MTIELSRFDAAQHLTEPEDQTELLADAVATGDAQIIAKAIGIVARAHAMVELSKGERPRGDGSTGKRPDAGRRHQSN